jgi:membrane protein YqaA with SNARE-associated domain
MSMAKTKKKLARKAVKSTAKHTAHGKASRLKQEPLRTTTLLAVGCVVGGLVGWMLARTGSEAGEAPQTPSA